jgi:hypothetical protein
MQAQLQLVDDFDRDAVRAGLDPCVFDCQIAVGRQALAARAQHRPSWSGHCESSLFGANENARHLLQGHPSTACTILIRLNDSEQDFEWLLRDRNWSAEPAQSARVLSKLASSQ